MAIFLFYVLVVFGLVQLTVPQCKNILITIIINSSPTSVMAQCGLSHSGGGGYRSYQAMDGMTFYEAPKYQMMSKKVLNFTSISLYICFFSASNCIFRPQMASRGGIPPLQLLPPLHRRQVLKPVRNGMGINLNIHTTCLEYALNLKTHNNLNEIKVKTSQWQSDDKSIFFPSVLISASKKWCARFYQYFNPHSFYMF